MNKRRNWIHRLIRIPHYAVVLLVAITQKWKSCLISELEEIHLMYNFYSELKITHEHKIKHSQSMVDFEFNEFFMQYINWIGIDAMSMYFTIAIPKIILCNNSGIHIS